MSRVNELLQELQATIREEVAALPQNVLTLGEEIAAARKAARMSLQEVANIAGMSKAHIWELEQGRTRNPTISAVHAISKATGVPFLRLAQAALNSTKAPA